MDAQMERELVWEIEDLKLRIELVQERRTRLMNILERLKAR